jgi:hypothetical protein
MVSTVGDVLAGVQKRWNDAALPKLIPGGLHALGRVPAVKPAGPYAVVNIRAQAKEETSGNYIQPFVVTIRVWNFQETDDTKKIGGTLAAAFDWKQALFSVTGADKVIGIKPMTEALEQDQATKQAQDVLITTGSWEVWLQVTRP